MFWIHMLLYTTLGKKIVSHTLQTVVYKKHYTLCHLVNIIKLASLTGLGSGRLWWGCQRVKEFHFKVVLSPFHLNPSQMLTQTPSVILMNLPLYFLFLSRMFFGLQRQEYHWANHYYNSFENVHFIMNSLCNTLSYGPVCHFGLQRQEYLKSNHYNSEEETNSLWSCIVIILLVAQFKIFSQN